MKDAKGNVIGIHVIMTIKKNKLAPPFRKYEFDIIFGKGIVENDYIFDEVRSYCETNPPVPFEHNGKKLELSITGSGAWKTLAVNDATTGEVILEKKFYKNEFGDLMSDPDYKPFIDRAIDAAYTLNIGTAEVSVDGAHDDEKEEVDEAAAE